MGKGVMNMLVRLVKPKPKPKTKGKIEKGKPFTEEDVREAFGEYAEEYMPKKKKEGEACDEEASQERDSKTKMRLWRCRKVRRRRWWMKISWWAERNTSSPKRL